MAEKIPPHNLEAERSVLGAALLSREALSDIVEVVRPEDFYDGANKEIFNVIREMFRENRPVDIVTVGEELGNRKLLGITGGISYLGSLSGEVPSARNGKEYAKIVAEKAAMRSLIHTAEDIREKGFSEDQDASEILNYAEQEIFRIAQTRQRNDYSHLKDVLITNIDQLDEAQKNRGKITGVTTGFRELDDLTNGFQRSDLIIIAARPAMGKTAFALNIAQNAAVKGDSSVMIFSLEMAKEQLGQRLLAIEAKVEMNKLKKGLLSSSDWDDIMVAADKLSKASITIDDTPGLNVFEMKNKCRRLKAERGLDLVLIDYLQLMQSESRTENRQQEISALSRQLKLLARELNCPVVVLSQLSRAPEQRPNKRPILSDLRESGAIEQDADIVIFLYRDDYYNKDTETPGICEVNIAKHRSGETRKIDLVWVDRYTKFSDIAKQQ